MTVPFETPFGHGAETSLRRMIIQLILMGFFLLLFAIPTSPLLASDVRYKPYCAEKAAQSTVGDTGTTYDNVFQTIQVTNVKVPIVLGLAMDWSSGFTNALVRGSIPCKTDIRQLMQTLVLSRVTAPIQQQIGRFNTECYLIARGRFDSRHPDLSTYDDTMRDYGGEADLNWMGSHVLRELYYDKIYPSAPVPGFSYASYPLAADDEAVKHNELDKPKNGYPTCEQWWSDEKVGLERLIVNDVNAAQPANNHLGRLSISETVKRWMTQLSPFTKLTGDDVIARSVLYDSKGDYGGFGSDSAQLDTNMGQYGAASHILMGAGKIIKQYTFNPLKRDATADVLPIIRACVLFFVIMFTPLVFIFGRYQFGVGISICCAFFILIFLDYIWAMNKYLENALLASTSDPSLGNVLVQHPTIVNMMGDFYFFSASILLLVLGWAGVKVGTGLDKMIAQASNMASANADGAYALGKAMTKQGWNVVKSAGKTGVKMISSIL